jgi:pimeloyl-ACP methyl ester carboxylesterase
VSEQPSPTQGPIQNSGEIPQPHRVLDLTMDDGAIIRVRRHGNPQGPRLVLSHGNGLATNLYFPFWNLLRDRYDLILFDVRNHGENPLHGGAGHDMAHFIADLEKILGEVQREFGAKPIAGVFHSLSGLIAIRHALLHQDRWRALVLFDPPLFPRDGHPLRLAQQNDKDSLSVRARKRTERYKTPDDFARQLGGNRGFTRWRPEAYALMARATLRYDPAAGDWTLACPRELEARVFEENRDPSLWVQLGEVKAPIKIIGADPNLEGAGPPALISQAVAAETAVDYEAIPETTHFLQIEQPEACVRAMETFLARHGMAA